MHNDHSATKSLKNVSLVVDSFTIRPNDVLMVNDLEKCNKFHQNIKLVEALYADTESCSSFV